MTDWFECLRGQNWGKLGGKGRKRRAAQLGTWKDLTDGKPLLNWHEKLGKA